jgi:hypothetical protein
MQPSGTATGNVEQMAEDGTDLQKSAEMTDSPSFVKNLAPPSMYCCVACFDNL